MMEIDTTKPDLRMSAPPKPPASITRRLRRGVRWLLIQVLSVLGILLSIELVLLLIGTDKLDSLNPGGASLPSYDYPAHPDEFVKIAVFGGSAAAGAYSPRGFDAVLEHELEKRFPDKNIYLRNYASHGYPFHRHQAEYVKELIGQYDFLLIYCGNNEAENWYDDSGYWRIPEYKDAKDLIYVKPPGTTSAWAAVARAWLTRHSRMFAVATRVKRSFEPPVGKNLNRDYREFEPAPSLPETERQAIVSNFAQDLREICELAERHDKQVLLSVSATFETWPPSFSTFRADLSPEEKSAWLDAYQQGLTKFKAADFAGALTAWATASAIDSEVAILNHRIGMSYLGLGKDQQARRYLRKAIDREGHYFRSVSSLHDAGQRLAKQFARLHYVDVEEAFHQACRDGITDDELFVDVCHPSFLGHVIIGETFLAGLLRLEPFSSWPTKANPPSTDWPALARELYAELRIGPDEEAVAMAGAILYYFDIAHFCAYPDRCAEEIQKLVVRLESLRGEEPMARTFAAVSKARLAMLADDTEASLREINLALEISPAYLETILELKAWNHYVGDEFEQAGIHYSTSEKVFTLEP